ncbi:MAG TPA: type III secretion system cytoplasmic ring protein SctQ [Burkholderiaceae bacterium]|nr:type III secretion system cytoplasmic ring protein SctQ [Burkholderiaceae bacterium]
MAFDARFARMVASLTRSRTRRFMSGQATDAVLVSLRGLSGKAEVCADARAWPALVLALRDADPQEARDLVSILLAEPLAALERIIPGLTVSGVRLGRSDPAGIWVRTGEFEFGLQGMDEVMAQQVCGAMAKQPPASPGHIAELRLPARITLFSRLLSVNKWRGLEPADVVLGSVELQHGSRLQGRVTFGLGITMQAKANIDLRASSATLSEDLEMMEEDEESDAPPLNEVGELNVPVSFELDSARISLNELAAIGAGSVIELQTIVKDASVRLVCMGQVVGSGKLVVIGDHLGVRVERMGTSGLERAWSRE